MRVPPGLVLTATAVVASPLLWLVHDGSVPLGVAVERFLICLVACWVLLAVVGRLAFSPLDKPLPRPDAPGTGTAGTTGAAGAGAAGTADAAADPAPGTPLTDPAPEPAP